VSLSGIGMFIVCSIMMWCFWSWRAAAVCSIGWSLLFGGFSIVWMILGSGGYSKRVSISAENASYLLHTGITYFIFWLVVALVATSCLLLIKPREPQKQSNE